MLNSRLSGTVPVVFWGRLSLVRLRVLVLVVFFMLRWVLYLVVVTTRRHDCSVEIRLHCRPGG